jgi:hypothetical protein
LAFKDFDGFFKAESPRMHEMPFGKAGKTRPFALVFRNLFSEFIRIFNFCENSAEFYAKSL